MDPSDVAAFTAAARRFADEVIAPTMGVGRDGDLAKLDRVLTAAEEAGFLASARPKSPGYDYGAWGRAALEDGPAASLAVLEELATACAGVAACVHFAGLGGSELRGAKRRPARASVAICGAQQLEVQETGLPALLDAWLGPDVKLAKNGRTARLTGRKPFVYAGPDCEGFVVYARGEGDRWARVWVPADAKGLEQVEVGLRMGLAACQVTHLELCDVAVRASDELPEADPAQCLGRLWLGLCAIAIGNGRGALRVAHRYAAERRQGGGLIREHAAVQLLLGGAESRLAAGGAALRQVASRREVDTRLAAMLKARLTLECAQAVTDCLQVLGGYGYMEDYRLEKRLRDALTLKSMAGRPDDLLRLAATTGSER